MDGGRGTTLALAAEKINDMSRGGYIGPRAVRASAVGARDDIAAPTSGEIYSASRSIVVPSNTLFTVRTAHIFPHMVQVPSVEAGEAS